MIYYFSGTGNSAWVAGRMAELTGDKALRMAFDTDEIPPQLERLGLVFPTYGWDVPAIVRRFIGRLKERCAEPAYLYYVTTCGDDTGMLHERLKGLLEMWEIAGGWAVIMPESYVALPGFDVDSKERETAKLTAAQRRVEEIAGLVEERKRGVCDVHRGVLPRTKTYVLGSLFKRFCMGSRRFKIEDRRCIGCGRCVEVCPTGTISMEEGRPVWREESDCTMCLSCYHHCPRKAIEYGRFTANKGQYVCPLGQKM